MKKKEVKEERRGRDKKIENEFRSTGKRKDEKKRKDQGKDVWKQRR